MIYHLDKPLFEPITEMDMMSMIKYDDEKFCFLNNFECILFYNEHELDEFLNKTYEQRSVD